MKLLGTMILITTFFSSCRNDLNNFNHFNRQINGVKEGLHIVLNNDGDILCIKQYKTGKLNGETIYFNKVNDEFKVQSKINYNYGLKEDFAYYFYRSGVIRGDRYWKKDRKVGKALSYYDTTGEVKEALLYNNEGFLIRRRIIKDGKIVKEEISEAYKKQLDDIEM